MTGPRTPTSRLVVAAYLSAGALALVGLVALASMLRLDHPLTGPLTPEGPEQIDGLREEIPCALPAGREGSIRQSGAEARSRPVEVTSNQLYDCPQTWDGQTVRVTGEVIGALLDRDDAEVWTQLNDDVYGDVGAPLPTHRDFRGGNAGVGVVLPDDVASGVDWIGGPGRHGDVLEVTGVFHRVDESTGEVAIIRVESASLVTRGRVLQIPDSPMRPVAAIIAALIAVAVTLLERRTRQRR